MKKKIEVFYFYILILDEISCPGPIKGINLLIQ